MNKKIILIGFMGTGKTTIGKKLAENISFSFIDSDNEIVRKEKMSINSIFEEKGEEYFRNVESIILKDLLQLNTPTVISTGGGIILKDINRNLLREHLVINLEASVDVIYSRLINNKERPLLLTKDVNQEIIKLYNLREKLYKHIADITVNTDNKKISEIIKEIISQIVAV